MRPRFSARSATSATHRVPSQAGQSPRAAGQPFHVGKAAPDSQHCRRPEGWLAHTLHPTHRAGPDNPEAITSYVQEMSQFLMRSDLTETRAVHRSFVKEVGVAPGKAAIRYTIPMPGDSPLGGRDAQEIGLGSPVLSTVHHGCTFPER